MHRYAVDYNKCIWCGLCTPECPTEACQHSLDYDHALYDRKRLVYEFVDPKHTIPCHKETRLDMNLFVPNFEEEKAKLKAKRAKAAEKAEQAKIDAAKEKADADKPAEPTTEPGPDPEKGE